MDQSRILMISHSLFPEETALPQPPSWEVSWPWRSLDCCVFSFFHTWRTKVPTFMLLSAFQERVCQEPIGFTPGLASLNSKNKEENKHTWLWNVKRAVHLSECDDFSYCLLSAPVLVESVWKLSSKKPMRPITWWVCWQLWCLYQKALLGWGGHLSNRLNFQARD